MDSIVTRTAVGRDSSAADHRSSAVGRRSSAADHRSSAVGRRSSAVGRHSSDVGRRSSAAGRRSTTVATDQNTAISCLLIRGNLPLRNFGHVLDGIDVIGCSDLTSLFVLL